MRLVDLHAHATELLLSSGIAPIPPSELFDCARNDGSHLAHDARGLVQEFRDRRLAEDEALGGRERLELVRCARADDRDEAWSREVGFWTEGGEERRVVEGREGVEEELERHIGSGAAEADEEVEGSGAGDVKNGRRALVKV